MRMEGDTSRPAEILSAGDPPPLDTLDPSALVELRVAGGREFVALLIDQFLDESDVLAGALRIAIDAGDGEYAAAAARQLRVCAQSIGVIRLAALCHNLEACFQSSRQDAQTAGILRSIETELQRAQRELVAEKAKLGSQRRVGVRRPWE